MVNSVKQKYVDIVDKLVKDFWSSNRKNLEQEEAVMFQDFVSRGLFNTTSPASNLMGINKKYVQKLVQEVIGYLEENYSHLSPRKFKCQVLKAVEAEYVALGNKVTGCLQKSQQLSEVEQFQNSVTTDMTETKKDVENKFDLWVERSKKNKRLFQFEAKIGWSEIIAGLALFLAVMTAIGNNPTRQYLLKRSHIEILEVKQSDESDSIQQFHIRLENSGNLPLENLQLVFNTFLIENSSKLSGGVVRVQLIPSLPYDLKVIGRRAHMTILSPIAPSKELNIFISGTPLDVILITNQGDVFDLSSREYRERTWDR